MSSTEPTPKPNDILSGRGNGVNKHPGNLNFRKIVESYKHQYVVAIKCEKPAFSQLIVKKVQSLSPPGRFLKKDASAGHWYELSPKEALTKTRQALREGAPTISEGAPTIDEEATPDLPESGSGETEAETPKKVIKKAPVSCYIIIITPVIHHYYAGR